MGHHYANFVKVDATMNLSCSPLSAEQAVTDVDGRNRDIVGGLFKECNTDYRAEIAFLPALLGVTGDISLALRRSVTG
jgi:hypothetical protein